MRNDLIEIEQIEKYLSQQLNDDEKLRFEARMIIDTSFTEKVEAQKQVHKFVRIFSRRQQRSKLEIIYRQLLHETQFAEQLKNIFA